MTSLDNFREEIRLQNEEQIGMIRKTQVLLKNLPFPNYNSLTTTSKKQGNPKKMSGVSSSTLRAPKI